MKKHLPSRLELVELAALSLMIIGLQYAIGSWGWTFIFCLGFVWNWAILNGWTKEQDSTKKYRFSSLRFIHFFHQIFQKPFVNYPRVQKVVSIFPAALFLGAFAAVADSQIPWWVAILGSLGFLLLRYQLNFFVK